MAPSALPSFRTSSLLFPIALGFGTKQEGRLGVRLSD